MENGEEAKRTKKDRHNCCLPQCSEVQVESNHMHRVPKNEAEREKWAIAIKTGKKLQEKMTVCSRHFKETDYIITLESGKKRRLKPGTIPSQNLPLRVHDKVLTSLMKRKMQGRADRVKMRAVRALSAKKNTGLQQGLEGSRTALS